MNQRVRLNGDQDVWTRRPSKRLIILGSWVRAPPAPPAEPSARADRRALNAGGPRPSPARTPGRPERRDRLWARWAEIDKNLEAYAARRPVETAVVVLEPRAVAGA
ncbi:hypothetical protein Noca_1973 [Nocardioides sp. JS614]|nr:hypothetical protein Noca_1973 [Nocardioides sp. JS614]